MANELVKRSPHAITKLTEEDAYDVVEVSRLSRRIGEIVAIANEEVAGISGHTIGTVAELTIDAALISKQLSSGGYRSEVFDEASLMILQVTKQNLGTLANAAQKAIIEGAVSMMR